MYYLILRKQIFLDSSKMTYCTFVGKDGSRCTNFVGKGKKDYCLKHLSNSKPSKQQFKAKITPGGFKIQPHNPLKVE